MILSTNRFRLKAVDFRGVPKALHRINNKHHTIRMNFRPHIIHPGTVKSVWLATAILTSLVPVMSEAATKEEERKRGQLLLQQANVEMQTATRLSEAAERASQVANQDRLEARKKVADAQRLRREAAILIGDANKVQAEEYRAQAQLLAIRIKTEETELARVKGLEEHEKVAGREEVAALAKLKDAAAKESIPAEKAELTKVLESSEKDLAAAKAEYAIQLKRIATGQAEIARLQEQERNLIELADKLAPRTPAPATPVQNQTK